MQKKIFIIGGATLIIGTIGLFLYVFFIQKAKDQTPTVSATSFEISESTLKTTDQGDNSFTQNIPESATITTSTSSAEYSDEAQTPKPHFTQLSTTPVAGMVFMSSTTVRYSERGTGMITDLNLYTMSTETTSVNLTGVISATFNSNGSRIILKINDALTLRFFAGVIAENVRGEKTLRGTFLPNNTTDATFTGATNIRYLLATQNGGEIHTYEPSTQADKIESTIPFSQARFVTSNSGTMYLVTTPSASMNGTIYHYTPTSITALTSNNRGLTAFAASSTVYVTAYRNNKLSTVVLDGVSQKPVENIINTDTCVSAPTTIYCARPYFIPTEEYPDRWYQGEEHHADAIFSLDTKENKLLSLADPQGETGQSFDILKLVANPTRDDHILLINKNNDTLWLYTR